MRSQDHKYGHGIHRYRLQATSTTNTIINLMVEELLDVVGGEMFMRDDDGIPNLGDKDLV